MYLARKDRGSEARPGLGAIVGGALLAVAAICTGAVAAMPAPYVIEYPGPVFDVLGQIDTDGQEVPLISIPVEETYPTEGSLRLLTVYRTVPQHAPSWIDVAIATLDPRQAVLPVEAVYPPGFTPEDSAEQAELEMVNSQHSAVAAALHQLGYELGMEFVVAQVQDGGAAQGVLEAGDAIRAVNGVEPDTLEALRAEIAEGGADRPVRLDVLRGEEELQLEVTPRPDDSPGGSGAPVLGILVSSQFVFPFTVTIQLDSVGGPSAGMMFALGIYDKLTPGGLTGGADIAGTGTIDARGRVGVIGGIRQKLWGAADAGADWFLAPADNCDEVVGHVPDGLRVVAVRTLSDAIGAVAAISAGDELGALPDCRTVLDS